MFKKLSLVALCLLMAVSLFASCGNTTSETSSTDIATSSEVASEVTSGEEVSSEETSSEYVVPTPEMDIAIPLLNQDLSNTKRVKILPFGDSFTAISPAAYRFYLHEMLYENGNFFQYVGTLECPDERLGGYYKRYQATGGHTVLNAQEVYKTKIKEIVDYDVMLVLLGANGYNPSIFDSEYETLLNLIFEDNPIAVVFAVGWATPETAQKTENMVNAFKKKGFDITYVNVFHRDDIVFDSVEDYITHTAERGHLNDSGNLKFATVLFENIKDKITELNKIEEETKRLPAAVEKITLSKLGATVKIGESTSVTYEIFPASADVKSVKWHTTNPDIAIVNEYGEITGVSKGEATITAVSLDGMAKTSMIVTVSDETFKTETVGTKVFEETFNNADNWTNADTYFSAKANALSLEWSHANLTFTSKNSVQVGEDFTLQFGYASGKTTADNLYTGISFGDYEVRVYNGSKKVSLVYKGEETFSEMGRCRHYEYCTYTLTVKNGTATVYRDNQVMLTANAGGSVSSNLTINYQQKSAVAEIDNIIIMG